ncbi:hypothetical protein TWF569_002580 [Orbilia oligospora]|uniref:Tr-type G domain-containing protein n=1 Tax=Orbilia oligospora TaxID=2813651 RepID=A0A7C8JA22_ORBOL|nr:hypothetical protein TWF102_002928 [Orbilia oligospora]KAF3103286.1 hypothetical protein TWF103_007277 [Orbilia oligospora]KAF3105699.1 hypothetical protein TWF706_003800 [Orbilia oligospora]KAF3120551.1 hypothetical protein TWF703_002554 [Orbilia oligospora]KAF3121451.1 hypothetical protein TWF569_002580 [Orbilia oligospora]
MSGPSRGAAGNALSDFVEHVANQAAARHRTRTGSTSKPAGTAPPKLTSTGTNKSLEEAVDELSFIDDLGLNTDDGPRVKLRDQLLGNEPGLDGLLRRRLEEGRGEALFEVGYEDNGDSMGFSKEEYEKAYDNVVGCLGGLSAQCAVLQTANVDEKAEEVPGDGKGARSKLMVRIVPKSMEELLEIRVAVVGNVDAGKSTMLGVLVKGQLDDGRGKARVNLFRHKHEIESGRTSSVGMEIMGFDAQSQIVTSQAGRKLTWEEIGKKSAKVIAFTDLAGHEKYLRTTVFGLLGTSPDYCLLMVAANNGLIGMSKEHLGIAVALNVPIMVVITKIDMTPPNILAQTVNQITKILKSGGARKIPIFIKSKDEAISTATHFVSDRICPIFQVSNVTGEGLDFVRTFLNILPYHGQFDQNAPFEFYVNDTFSVPFVGTVVSGVVKSGIIHAGDPILIGPDSLGNFISTQIRSIERKRIGVPLVTAGQSASFALRRVRRRDVRKGMVVLPKTDDPPPKASRQFVAEVMILSHATTIRKRYQAMLHVGPVSQTCSIIDLDRETVRTGDRALVAFKFVQRPEYILPGDKLLFREGRTKGLGVVKEIDYDENKPLNPGLKVDEMTIEDGPDDEKLTKEQKADLHGKGEKMKYQTATPSSPPTTRK